MIFAFVTIAILIVFFIITNIPVFGKLPAGERKKLISQLPNYKNGALQNLSVTPMQPEGVSLFDILKSFLFGKHPNKKPKYSLPSVKPDLTNYNNPKPEIIWFGHSSYLIKLPNMNVLVDPVFSDTPSPFSFVSTKAFAGTNIVKAEDFDSLDVILITHDHYDHLDYPTILKLSKKTKTFVCSLGVGAHLEKWGINKDKIIEIAWHQTADLGKLKFTAVPARHFTGRKFKRNQTLWSAFVMDFGNFKLFLGGDSGYDTHFKEIGKQHGPFDLAFLECGQYNAYWPFIHMFPEETIQAAIDLGAKVLMPVHWCKFTLSMHPWNEPIQRAVEEAKLLNVKITTPMLGETVIIDECYPSKRWWENIF
ncbi:MBL fold metallo-hydrolase [Pedobacter changchengzhani]|uniref:MBL fold metallo-hydrolase n=1 Tax=Pedobacter changchengzhani TaxID=2529274 RepID=A0A4R5MJZ0_9SPHI|nr:MBL fold metallo-hydrolase [Pedobacter changchengzhani]TDG35852.1 MBL fold metallo-hydrolase [Pedobacter changchengzhani]